MGPHALLSTSTKSASGTAASTYQYDAMGNTTSVTDTTGTTTLTWNGEDKLASVAKTGQAQGISYLYDADGNQLIRRDPGNTTLNLGSDELTLDTASGSMTDVRYYDSPGGITITRVTTATGGGQLVYQCADPHGTNGAQITTDSSQTVTRRPTDPFGNPRGTQPAAGSWAGDKGFIGGVQDDATGLTNLGAREYDPAHGRFLNPDPLLDLASPQQWNGYAYSNNDPINSSDPSGQISFSGILQAVGEVGVIAGEFVGFLSGLLFSLPPTTGSNGTGSGSNSDGGGSGGGSGGGGGSGNSRGTHKCGGWLSLSGLSCHSNNAVKRTKNFTTDHPIVRALIVTAIETAAGAACYGGGLAGTLETGGASAVEAAVGCGALVGAIGSGLNNILDEKADQSATGQLKAEASGAAIGAATGGLLEGGSQLIKSAMSSAADGAVSGLEEAAAGSCKNSFPAGTPVLLADGTVKPIDELTTTDKVTATDPGTGVTAPEQVVDTIVGHQDQDFTNLKVSMTISPVVSLSPNAASAGLVSTQHHPYWDNTTKRWTDAGDLKPGEQLQMPDGALVTVDAVRNYHTPPQTAYNLTVDHLHTYYVLAGTTPILVHNTAADCATGRSLWQLTKDGSSAMKRGGPFNTTFYKSSSDSTWWTPDTAGHAGSAFKVYEESKKGLQWIADADRYGTYIVGKWKGDTGYFIPNSSLRGTG